MVTKKKNVKPANLKKDKEKTLVSLEDREQMIRLTAYFGAEKNKFIGDSQKYWLEAEKEIDSK